MNKWVLLFFAFACLLIVYIDKSMIRYNPLSKKGWSEYKEMIDKSGGIISTKRVIEIILLLIMLSLGLCYLYQLELYLFIFLCVLLVLLFPSVYYFYILFLFQKKRFFNYIQFIRSFIEEFKKNPKLYIVLKEMSLKSMNLNDVCTRLNYESDIHVIYSQLLNRYPHYLLRNTFTLAYCSEREGMVNIHDALDEMVIQIDHYEKEMNQYYSDLQVTRSRILLLTFLAMIIAYSSRFMLFELPIESTKEVYQIAIFCFLILCMFTILFSYQCTCTSFNSFEEKR